MSTGIPKVSPLLMNNQARLSSRILSKIFNLVVLTLAAYENHLGRLKKIPLLRLYPRSIKIESMELSLRLSEFLKLFR